MKTEIYNVHRREIQAPAGTVGAVLDTLASADDRLWPVQAWPAMSFDRPGITVGGRGGHGPIGYRVESAEAGRSVTFTFTGRPSGLVGGHQYVVQHLAADRSVLWHLSNVRPRGLFRVTWPLFWAPLHNALIEDSLDRGQRSSAPGTLAAAAPWSLYVKVLRATVGWTARRRGRPGPPSMSKIRTYLALLLVPARLNRAHSDLPSSAGDRR